MTVETYSQRDPRWANQHYGLPNAAPTSTIGAYGCAITCIAQKLTILGFPTTPPDIQKELQRVGAYTAQSHNFVDWVRVPLIYPQFRYNGRVDYTDQRPASARIMNLIRTTVNSGDPVIVYVDASAYQAGLQQHFVLVIGEMDSGDLAIANPWNGQIQSLRPYGKTDPIAIRGVKWLSLNLDLARAA